MALNVRGNTNWNENQELLQIESLKGQKVGEWKSEPGYSGDEVRYYIDTPFGRFYDQQHDEYNAKERSGDNYDEQGNKRSTPGGAGGQVGIGRYSNQHGSDGITGQIDKDGVFHGIQMNRESNRDRNKFLLAAAALATAGAAYGVAGAAGATGGTTAAGTTTAATGTTANTLTAAEIASINSAGVIESGSLAAGGYTMPAAGAAASAGTSAAELAAMDAAAANIAPTAAAAAPSTGAPIAQSAARSAGSTRQISTAANVWETLLGGGGSGATSSGLWERVLAGMATQAGQAIIDNNKRDEAREDRDNQRQYDAALLADERAYKVRNMGADKMATVNWGLATVAARPNYKPVNPFSEEAPPSVLNTPRLPPGPIQAPVIESAQDRFNRYGTPT